MIVKGFDTLSLMKIITLLIATILINTSSIAALGPLNHLIPADSFGNYFFNAKYITEVDLNIGKDDEGYLLQFNKYPSFDSISSTVIIQNYKTDKYRIAYTTKKWKKRKYSKRNIKTIYKNIPNETASLISKIYQYMLIQTHYSYVANDNKVWGLDGTTYEFFINSAKHGRMYGETWSPDKNTETYYLVAISEALNQFVRGKLQEQNLNKFLKNNLINLKVEFEKNNSFKKLLSDFKSQEPILECNTDEFVPLVAHASIAIQELAQEKNIKETEVGAILMVWRMEACELLDENAHLYPETVDAIDKECSKLIRLNGRNEKEYIEDARKHLSWHKDPSHVVLAWAQKVKNVKSPAHNVIATDGVEAISVKYPGYGYDGETKVECIKQPNRIFYF